ncbi:MAG: flagellin hook IN motif-containing protein [Thermodesulfobacteriota bacterium]
MRTTLNTLFSRINANLHTINKDIYRLNDQISSGRQMSKISDNPANMVSSLLMRTKIAELDQFQSNINYGDAMVTAAENALRQIKEQVMEAKVIAIEAQNPVAENDRDLIAPKVANLLDQAVTLANTQIAGKYIFGGTRTSGYTEAEPKPFVRELIDGYRINGAASAALSLFPQPGIVQDGTDLGIAAVPPAPLEFYFPDTAITEQVNFADLTNPAATINGINMTDAFNLSAAINADTSVTSSLTTQTGGTTPATAGGPLAISFDVTGTIGTAPVSFTASGSATEIAQQTVDAVNSVSSSTGVMALRGNGANGGVADSVVFRNVQDGDASAITFTGPAAGSPEDTLLGFDDLNDDAPAGADINHNTGSIALSSPTNFTFGNTTSTVLASAGLDTATIAPAALDIDGNPISYNVHTSGTLGLHDLKINGIWVPAAQNDGLSNIDPDLSAAAKAAAINSVSGQTGVTAKVTPVTLTASAPVTAGAMGSGDLIINGIDIFPVATAVIAGDTDNVIIDAINARQASTGVYATHDATGTLVLKVDDGRNLQVETSANGEIITSLNGAPGPSNQVYSGRIQLYGDRTYMLESSLFNSDGNLYEAGLIALGLAGGSAVTGEATDVAGDGKLSALTIADHEGNVRYAGDREGELEIKVGSVEKMSISENGQVALKDSHVFDALQKLEDTLLGKNFTEVTSLMYVTNTAATFASGNTGLPNDPRIEIPQIVSGSFTVSITDHEHLPPEVFEARIGVDINVDTPATIAAKLDGIPGLNASWDSDGYLQMSTTDPDRYTMSMGGDSSNFSGAVRVTNTDMQVFALDSSIAELNQVFEDLTTKISDFGARGNRLDVQSQIFTNLDLATKESLSEKQDTDIVKAITELQAAETAYEAALATAARTMQMSLLDFLQ